MVSNKQRKTVYVLLAVFLVVILTVASAGACGTEHKGFNKQVFKYGNGSLPVKEFFQLLFGADGTLPVKILYLLDNDGAPPVEEILQQIECGFNG